MHANDDLTVRSQQRDVLAQRILARRIEEASLNAWPAMRQSLLDGWILRFSRGFTKRSNSVIPLYPSLQANSSENLLEKIRYCENLYAAEQLQTVFRLTSMGIASEADPADTDFDVGGLDQLLSERGYAFDDTSLVLTSTDLPDQSMNAIRMLPLADWLPVYCRLTGMLEPASELHRIILKGITGNCGFATIPVGDQPIACGLAVVEHDLVGLFDIFTHPEFRGQGAARKLVIDLLAWARSQGAQRAYLQVLATNSVAARLYDTLNFEEIYRYWYRISR
jgi:GNAT superfamily N-acetyltransferase